MKETSSKTAGSGKPPAPLGSQTNPVTVQDPTQEQLNGSSAPSTSEDSRLTSSATGANGGMEALSTSQHSPTRTRSRSPPAKISTFHPELPPLPRPLETPIVRKRKASEDLKSGSFAKESKVELAADVHDAGEAKEVVKIEEEKAKKLRNAGTRTLWTLIMISGFLSKSVFILVASTYMNQPQPIALLAMGHAYMILLVLLCSSVVYREVTRLFTLREDPESKDPWSKTLNWYFFASANYFLYGESIIYYFKVSPLSVLSLLMLKIHSSMLCLQMLYLCLLLQTIVLLASCYGSSVCTTI